MRGRHGHAHHDCVCAHPHAHHWRRRTLQRQIFAALVVAILAAGGTVGMLAWTLGGGHEWRRELRRVEVFFSRRLADVLDDPRARHELVAASARDLGISIVVTDPQGRTLDAVGRAGGCSKHVLLRVPPEGPLRARARICMDTGRLHPRHWVGLVMIAASTLVLWTIAGLWARRLSRPLRELTRVARELGEGVLESRVRLHRGAHGEVGELGHALNEMASRIERQMVDQRQLLATVSHELRSPLARMRLLVELAREHPDRDVPSEMEAELVEMDALVEDLLTGARLDFGAVNRRALDPREIAQRAADRLGAGIPSVEVTGEPGTVRGDPTLLARAVGALLDNARKHGGGVRAFRVRADRAEVVFEVDDAGTGFLPEELPRVFEPFYRGGGAGGQVHARGVGLGLALVRRIAEAHGGRALAENLPGGGARVSIAIPR